MGFFERNARAMIDAVVERSARFQRLAEQVQRQEDQQRQVLEDQQRQFQRLEDEQKRLAASNGRMGGEIAALKLQIDTINQCLTISQRSDGVFESDGLVTVNSRIGLLERCLGLAGNEERPAGAEGLERLLDMRLGQLETRLMTHLEGAYGKAVEADR